MALLLTMAFGASAHAQVAAPPAPAPAVAAATDTTAPAAAVQGQAQGTAAAPTPAPPSAPAPVAAPMQPMVVTGTRNERRQVDVPASVDIIDRDTLRDAQPRVNLSEALVRVPGLVILNRQNYAQDLQLSIRGFGSRSTFGVRGVRLYVDGVPASFPDGQGQVSHFPINAAERVEVLRGPFSALYGNASGGVVALTTRLPQEAPNFEPSVLVGAYGTRKIGFNGQGGVNGNAFNLDVSRFTTDGQRDHSQAKRDSAQLRLGFTDTPLGRIRGSINTLSMPDSQDPLGLTRAQLTANPDQASPQALQFNTRKTTRQTTAGGELQTGLWGEAKLTIASWLGTRGVNQYQAIPVATQTPANHPGGVIDLNRRFGGADLRIDIPVVVFDVTVGLDFERLEEDRRGFNNFVGSTLGVQGLLRRDEQNSVQSLDPYIQTEWHLGDAWRLYAGVRRSTVRFNSNDRFISGNNRDDSGSASFSNTNPTAGVSLKLTPKVSVYTAYGRGFETPTLNELAYRSDGSAGFNFALKPARSNNVEAGIKGAPLDSVRFALAVFDTRTEDEIVVRTNVGGRSAFGNAAKTSRRGAEASLETQLGSQLSITASAAALRARFDDAFLTCGPPPCTTPTLPVAAGNTLPGVPATTAFIELRWRTERSTAAFEMRGQSSLYVDDRNSDRAGGYGVLALSWARTFDVGATRPRVFARIDNLLDRRTVGSVIVNEANGRYFEPALGRTYTVGLDWKL